MTGSPGVIDTGAWDILGEQGKADYSADISARARPGGPASRAHPKGTGQWAQPGDKDRSPLA